MRTFSESRPTAPLASKVSVQLEALADEVFEAATAQARLGGQSARHPFGEAIWNPDYPDLFFLNGIERLVAPDWSVADFEAAVRQVLPGTRHFRAYSRDPKTIAVLGAAMTAAGYRHEVRVAMVQVDTPSSSGGGQSGGFPDSPSPYGGGQGGGLPDRPSPSGGGQGGGLRMSRIDDTVSWRDFEASIRADTHEHGWSPAMTDQYLRLAHWRATNTPHRYFLAYDRDRVIAHVGLFQNGASAYLHGLYTHPDARRRGAGRALTLAMTAEARALGCDRLTLQCVDDGYLPGYYAKLGYRPVGEQHLWTRQS
jgi:GNAT superfamily N-acetyltransferase